MKNITSSIQDAVDLLYPSEDPENDKIREDINKLLLLAESGYALVQWPESQKFMHKNWFEEEAILALGNEEETGSSAYFIPINRLV